MKKVMSISQYAFLVAALAALVTTSSFAQHFVEDRSAWKVETIKAKGLDTIRFEKHSFFVLPEVNDTLGLVYHEPMPDNIMPKSAIDIGSIVIQAESADEVVEILEREARKLGADWVISFNEPRRTNLGHGDFYYRSQARLYKVINPELVPVGDVLAVSPRKEQIRDFASAITWAKNYVASSEQ
jgi:hypothetical protein